VAVQAKAALGEAPGVADLDQQLGDRSDVQPAQLAQRCAALAHELLQLGNDTPLLPVERAYGLI
jgi:hypothetical protein